ncbi:hypothetical protein_gp014 [Bacillus phage vB_BceM_WH1]|nr:hypothetical protein_gp014 [Bacillus phage vB_BceM_WH1]
MITAEGMFLLSKDRNGESYLVKRGDRMYNVQATKRVNTPPRDWFRIGDTITLGGGTINAGAINGGTLRVTGDSERLTTVSTGEMVGELPARSTTSTDNTDDGVINHAEPQYCQFSFRREESLSTLATLKRFDDETESQFIARFHELLNILAPYNNDDALTSMRHEESLS